MDRTATEAAIKRFLPEIRERLGEAALISVAGEACANAGQVDQTVRVAMSFEQLTYEAKGLLEAATLFRRLSRGQGPGGVTP